MDAGSCREGAVSIHRCVNKGQTLTIHRNTREFKELNKDDIVLPTEKIKKPARAAVAIDSKKVRTMQDDRVTFTEEQIRSEASRCLSCGRSVVDPNKCIGCGICTTKCKFDAIRLEKVNDTHGREYFRTLLTVAGNTPAAIGRLVRKTRGR